MTEETLLINLGLTKQEANVYLSLLKAGPTSIRQIAAHTGINRGTTYEAIKSLITKGLVSYRVSGSRSKYFAENPDKINQIVNERQEAVARLKKESARLLPNLMAHSKSAAEAPRVSFYEDDEGIANILKDVLATTSKLENKEYYVYSSRALRQYVYRKFPNFTTNRLKEKIYVKVIAIGTGGDPAELSERKFLEESDDEVSSSYNIIYGNKVALISVAEDLTPFGVVIEEAGVAAMQRLLFNQLWQKL